VIAWPSALVEELARRRAIIFLGSGVSRQSVGLGAKRPPLWKEFLQAGATRCERVAKREIDALIKAGDLLTACEVLKDALRPADWASFIQEEFVQPQYEAAAIHNHVFRLDARLVVTQNFDKIYDLHAESQSHGTVLIKSYTDHDAAEFIRRRNRLVLKAHGSIDSPQHMVFTRGDYARARNHYAGFYALLDGLILTHTCLFVGCGMADPDISMMLERAVQLHPTTMPHYLVAGDKMSSQLRAAYERILNLNIIQYDSGSNHAELARGIDALKTLVDARRDEMAISREW